MASPSSRPFITCHALDTTVGKPAAGIKVELLLDEPSLSSKGSTYTSILSATTNSDGRVAGWNGSAVSSPEALIEKAKEHFSGERLRWKLKFYTEDYFGEGKTFFPFVEIPFYTDLETSKSHFHVPLLLGPWSYTTYRGS